MKTIDEKLKHIAAEKGVTILYACETGSRAWGFPSTDSDYDVRFIYQHDKDWYLSLAEQKDTIESMEGDLDITGWDLRKSLKLLKKSNAALIERFQSPIVYSNEGEFRTEFRDLITSYYSPASVFFHHYSLANNFRESYKGKSTVKLKALFYLLRSLLSCNWIMEDERVVPMTIQELLSKKDDRFRKKIDELILFKVTVDESYNHVPEDWLVEEIEHLFHKIESGKEALGIAKERGFGKLTDFFIKKLSQP